VSGEFLSDVLGQSQRIRALINQSAKELASMDSNGGHVPAEDHLNSGETVVRQLQDASHELMAVIRALQSEIRDRTMLDHQLAAAIEQEEGSRNAALHDYLTGLPNRVLFRDRLEHGIAQAKRHRWVLAVMFIDLDDFKTINDTYGHQAGDSVLQTIAARLRHSTREDDTVSRYGGDEFLYLLGQIVDEKHIAVIAAKILRAIQAPCNLIAQDVTDSPCMKASIGIAVFPRDGTTVNALIRSADEAMYVAKENESGYAFAKSECDA
jgi:diguanylate cyclase (GGDEF)-like protein